MGEGGTSDSPPHRDQQEDINSVTNNAMESVWPVALRGLSEFQRVVIAARNPGPAR